MSLADLRRDYTRARFDESDADPDPIRQFERWFAEARSALADVASWEPNAMTLATVGVDGRPSARIVLLKDVSAEGFSFFTNYESRKGRDLADRPVAALCFYWNVLERQVRVEGKVARLSCEASADYYHTRPLGSRLGAWASPQSTVIESRAALEARFAQASAKHGETPECPPHWGGYRLCPDYFEFWQGRASRLHDRIVYRVGAGGWERLRLAP
jgi:pyridoxamine 5'-phosphate oxidase